MYRQVLVHPDDTDYQRIVWRISPKKAIQHFRLLTVTYGLKNTGFLASGADSEEEAIQLIKQINEIVCQAGFTLRKWSLNSAGVLGSLSDTISAAMPLQFPDEQNPVKALGTHWLPAEDVFMFKMTMPTNGLNTKHPLHRLERIKIPRWTANY